MAGIYIHIPFCKQACHYCDFHFSTSLKKKDELIEALLREIVMRKEEFGNEIIETIYFGGGTPSLLSIEELQSIINTIYSNYNVSNAPEISLEANPDDLISVQEQTKTIYEDYLSVGINRLSIGIQSFFEDDLKQMNRAHNASEAASCLEQATKYFDNITIDLIYGIPNMSLDKWNQNLQKAFSFNVNHISSYALTVEPKTALDSFIKNGNYPPIDETLALEHFTQLVTETEKQGFEHYEISNFGKPNYFSKHNTSYWQGKPYLGIGPSAHSFYKNQRSWNVSNNLKYIKAISKNKLPSTIETLTKQDQFNEYLMTGLRTIYGVSLIKVEKDFGASYSQQLLQNAQKFIDENLLILENEFDSKGEITSKLMTTQKGKFLVDGITSDLFMI